MKTIRCLVLCSTRFGIPAILQLHHHGILAAVCVPASGDEISEHVHAVLVNSDLPVVQINETESDAAVMDVIRKEKINLALMLTWPYKISSAVFEMPADGFFNFHTGPLPKYRGPDPIFWQIKNREATAGIVMHKLDEGFDTGPVIIKRMIPLSPETTYGLLTTQLSQLAVEMIGILLKMLMIDIKPPEKIQDEIRATYFSRQSAADVTIDWNVMTAAEIVALAAACNPWNKGALTIVNGQVIRLPFAAACSIDEAEGAAAGTVISMSQNDMRIATVSQECIIVPFLYAEEGFLAARYFSKLKINVGNVFGGEAK